MKRLALTFRGICWSLIAAFCFEPLAQAAPELPLQTLRLSAPQMPIVPASVARVRDSFHGSSPKKIFLIEDAHANPSGQLNLAKSLEYLFKDEPSLSIVFVEAGRGDNSLTPLRVYGDAEFRRRTALRYVRSGELHGEEFLNLTSEKPFTIWGVEDLPLYGRSVDDYRRVVRARAGLQTYLASMRAMLDALQSRIAGPELSSVLAAHDAYVRGENDTASYFAVLANAAVFAGMAVGAYPAFEAFEKLRQDEAKVDFSAASRELARAIASLPEEDRLALGDYLKNDALAFRPDDRVQDGFFSLLEEKLATASSYPALSRYFDYRRRASAIDAEKLLDESRRLESELLERLARTDDERSFARASAAREFWTKLFDLALTPEEFENGRRFIEPAAVRETTGFLNRKIADLETLYERALFLEPGFEEAVKTADDFYTLTRARDERFVEETLRRMGESGQTQAALVTGGFHTPNLKALLKQKNISYVSLTPQVLAETNVGRYEEILLNQPSVSAKAAAAPSTNRIMAARLAYELSGTQAGNLVYSKLLSDLSAAAPASAARLPEERTRRDWLKAAAASLAALALPLHADDAQEAARLKPFFKGAFQDFIKNPNTKNTEALIRGAQSVNREIFAPNVRRFAELLTNAGTPEEKEKAAAFWEELSRTYLKDRNFYSFVHWNGKEWTHAVYELEAGEVYDSLPFKGRAEVYYGRAVSGNAFPAETMEYAAPSERVVVVDLDKIDETLNRIIYPRSSVYDSPLVTVYRNAAHQKLALEIPKLWAGAYSGLKNAETWNAERRAAAMHGLVHLMVEIPSLPIREPESLLLHEQWMIMPAAVRRAVWSETLSYWGQLIGNPRPAAGVARLGYAQLATDNRVWDGIHLNGAWAALALMSGRPLSSDDGPGNLGELEYHLRAILRDRTGRTRTAEQIDELAENWLSTVVTGLPDLKKIRPLYSWVRTPIKGLSPVSPYWNARAGARLSFDAARRGARLAKKNSERRWVPWAAATSISTAAVLATAFKAMELYLLWQDQIVQTYVNGRPILDSEANVRFATLDDLEKVLAVQAKSPAKSDIHLSDARAEALIRNRQALVVEGTSTGGALQIFSAVFFNRSNRERFDSYDEISDPKNHSRFGRYIRDFWIIVDEDFKQISQSRLRPLKADSNEAVEIRVFEALLAESAGFAKALNVYLQAYSRAGGAFEGLSAGEKAYVEENRNDVSYRAKLLLRHILRTRAAADRKDPGSIEPFKRWLNWNYREQLDASPWTAYKFRKIFEPSPDLPGWETDRDYNFHALAGLLLRQYLDQAKPPRLPVDRTIGGVHYRLDAFMSALHPDSRPDDEDALGFNVSMTYTPRPADLQAEINKRFRRDRRSGARLSAGNSYLFEEFVTRNLEYLRDMYHFTSALERRKAKPQRVLMIGAGRGIATLEMALQYPNWTFTAVNKEAGLWDEAEQNKYFGETDLAEARRRIVPETVDLDKPEAFEKLGAAKYDIVIFEDFVLTYMEQKVRAIENTYNYLLSENGLFAFSTDGIRAVKADSAIDAVILNSIRRVASIREADMRRRNYLVERRSPDPLRLPLRFIVPRILPPHRRFQDMPSAIVSYYRLEESPAAGISQAAGARLAGPPSNLFRPVEGFALESTTTWLDSMGQFWRVFRSIAKILSSKNSPEFGEGWEDAFRGKTVYFIGLESPTVAENLARDVPSASIIVVNPKWHSAENGNLRIVGKEIQSVEPGALPYADFVFSSGLFNQDWRNHIVDSAGDPRTVLDRMLAAIRALLKPVGFFIVSDPNRSMDASLAKAGFEPAVSSLFSGIYIMKPAQDSSASSAARLASFDAAASGGLAQDSQSIEGPNVSRFFENIGRIFGARLAFAGTEMAVNLPETTVFALQRNGSTLTASAAGRETLTVDLGVKPVRTAVAAPAVSDADFDRLAAANALRADTTKVETSYAVVVHLDGFNGKGDLTGLIAQLVARLSSSAKIVLVGDEAKTAEAARIVRTLPLKQRENFIFGFPSDLKLSQVHLAHKNVIRQAMQNPAYQKASWVTLNSSVNGEGKVGAYAYGPVASLLELLGTRQLAQAHAFFMRLTGYSLTLDEFEKMTLGDLERIFQFPIQPILWTLAQQAQQLQIRLRSVESAA